MEKDIDEVGKVSRYIKSKVEELDKENLANRQKPGCGKGTAVDRTRTATTISLKKKLKDKMAEFQTLREAIHQEHREIVERRVFTVTGTRADEETIERLIDTGDSEQIFQKAIQEQGRGQCGFYSYAAFVPPKSCNISPKVFLTQRHNCRI
ncbi:hypothetical protein F2P56_008727 [Juglans regia]|uniref:Syntaxin N-terminal domain-containing protein n=1 Tax=Juglans regia TaxID=51240 RepID=A0A834CYV8_JUGRE|nr:hypothetical protein F2P56_008727 [Juglans regia]